METWLSWTIMIVFGGAAYWYYSLRGAAHGRRRGRTLQRTADATFTKAKTDAADLWNDPKGTAKAATKAAKAKAPRKPAKKAAQQVGEKVEASVSAASSTAGADADDDLSPAVSPTLAPSGKDVSDMLEAPGAAPAVLRLTPGTKPERPKQQKQQPTGAAQETKKQRQNKKKAEEAKAQREEDEKQRQILLEKQRRAAREARGEPAKNGLQPAKAPSTGAWDKPQSEVKEAIAPAHGQLLDTFEREPASSTTSATGDEGHWTNLPSEEEQIRLAMEDSEWTTVPSGKKTRKAKANGATDTASEQGSESNVPQSPVKKTVAPVEPAKPKPQTRYDILTEAKPAASAGSQMDSDWPVV